MRTRLCFRIVPLFVAAILQAQSAYSDEVRPIAEKAARNLDLQYKAAGMAGLQESVRLCYPRATELKTRDAAAYCFILDFMVADLASVASRQFGYPLDSDSSFSSMNARAHSAFDVLDIEETDRGLITSEWSRAAIEAFSKLTRH